MDTLKYKIRNDVKKQIERRKNSGEWLNTGIPFDHGLRLNELGLKKIYEIFHSCNVTDRKENRLNFEILIANLIYLRDKRPVVVSLNANTWKKSRYVKAGPTTRVLIYQLYELGFINLKKGYRTEKESRMSRIWPIVKLLEYFPKNYNYVIRKPVELVELRDVNENLIEYKDTKKTRRIRNILQKINQINELAEIEYEGDILSSCLVAIFNKKFTLYGRLHTRGLDHYQGLSGEDRSEITINGESVVELDYSGLHPHLLYAKEGIQYDDDPYSVIDNRPEVRPYLKYVLLCMLNSKDYLTAERAGNDWLHKNHKEREALKILGITRVRPLIEAFMQIHEPISHYFCRGKDTGLRIMNLDATIALEVINHFASLDIPILAIHDSFIVQEQYKNQLYMIMEQTYEKNTGGFKIRIK